LNGTPFDQPERKRSSIQLDGLRKCREDFGCGRIVGMRLPSILLDVAIVFCVISGVVTINGCRIGHLDLIDPMSPYAFMAWLFSAAAAVVALVLSRRFRTVRPDALCHACGYDLRATPDRCPECGTVRQPNPRGPAGREGED
jgi:hypothetical protein